MALTIQDGYVVFTRGAQSAGYWLHVHNRAAVAAGSIASLYIDNDNKTEEDRLMIKEMYDEIKTEMETHSNDIKDVIETL